MAVGTRFCSLKYPRSPPTSPDRCGGLAWTTAGLGTRGGHGDRPRLGSPTKTGWGQHQDQDTGVGANPLGCTCTPTPSSRLGTLGPAMLCPLPVAPGSPRLSHRSLLMGMALSRDPWLDREVPFLLSRVISPHPVAGPLQRLLPPCPVPAPRIPGVASHGPAWLSGPVIHLKPVPVPAKPDSPQRFPKRPSRSPDVGLGGSPVPVSPSPRGGGRVGGAAGRQFLPRELV